MPKGHFVLDVRWRTGPCQRLAGLLPRVEAMLRKARPGADVIFRDHRQRLQGIAVQMTGSGARTSDTRYPAAIRDPERMPGVVGGIARNILPRRANRRPGGGCGVTGWVRASVEHIMARAWVPSTAAGSLPPGGVAARRLGRATGATASPLLSPLLSQPPGAAFHRRAAIQPSRPPTPSQSRSRSRASASVIQSTRHGPGRPLPRRLATRRDGSDAEVAAERLQ
jgi:hypothetical protein